MAGKLIFLADVHLHPDDPAGADLFFSFLSSVRAETEALYILGDLFDFWVGPKQLRLPPWARLLERLAEAVRGGPAVGVLGGNRDYLLDEASLAPYGLQSLGREHWLTRDGVRLALVHGDLHYPDSLGSRLFLKMIQGRAMRFLAHTVPLWVSLRVAHALWGWRRWVARDWDPETAPHHEPHRFLPLFERGADVVVCGHNHWACDYTAALGRSGCRLFALGEWATAPSYVEYADGTFRLVDPRLSGG